MHNFAKLNTFAGLLLRSPQNAYFIMYVKLTAVNLEILEIKLLTVHYSIRREDRLLWKGDAGQFP